MNIHFYKYQATGNDFILIDNRASTISLSQNQIKRLCDRKFGIGADGLMLIEQHPSLAFMLDYYNSDGTQSLCGNGSRAAVSFAAYLGMLDSTTTFEAYDGPHDAELLSSGNVRLKMNDVSEIRNINNDMFIHTGSPHYIRFVNAVKEYPVFEEGRKIRFRDEFANQGGTNVNFVERMPNNSLFVRTYERGVENETLSCGTGITAAVLAASFHGYASPVSVHALGGDLTVEFTKSRTNSTFTDIYLIGPAKMVFEGNLEL